MKKEKIKYEQPRRRRAIKRSSVCLCLILIGIFVCKYGFLPSSALREAEEYYVTGRTELVTRSDIPVKFTGIGCFALCENENVLMHAGIKYNVFMGWYRAVTSVLDCSKSTEPVDVGWHSISGGKSGRCSVFFGRANDESIASAEIAIVYEEEPELNTNLKVDFIEHDGRLYFCTTFPYEKSYADESFVPYINCYDGSGRLVYSGEISINTSSMIG